MQSHLTQQNRPVFLAFAFAAILGCKSTTTPCDPGQPLVNATLYMQGAAEYRASAKQTYGAARRALDAALATPAARPRAIILDLDETALDNSQFAARMIARHQPFTFGSDWSAWVAESASTAVPGAKELLVYAQSRGVTPVYITNRTVDMEAATRANLEKVGFPLAADTLLMRAKDGTTDKSARRNAVESRYEVLLLLGDDINDFTPRATLQDDAPWGTRWFILPNAIYGSWRTGPPCL